MSEALIRRDAISKVIPLVEAQIKLSMGVETFETDSNAALWTIARALLTVALELNAINERAER